MEPDVLNESLPKFKPWISPRSWSHWEKFLTQELEKLGRIPDTSSRCPLQVLQATSQRVMHIGTITHEPNDSSDGGRDLENMLDEERIPVAVCMIIIM